MRERPERRAGPHFLVLPKNGNHEEDGRRKKIAMANWLGLTASAAGCARLEAGLKRVRFHVQVAPLADGPLRCTLGLQPAYRPDLEALDAAGLAAAEITIARHSLRVVPGSCQTYAAFVGAEPGPYRACRVEQHPPARG